MLDSKRQSLALKNTDASVLTKKIRPDLPVLAQTAYAMFDEEKKAFDSGCDDYITKPINKEVLITKIKKLLTNK